LVIALIWYSLVAIALSTGAISRADRKAKGGIERTRGALMIIFGVHLATAD
jgi:threonine/homoserine/homoserine lactone efflux protein